MAPPPVATRTQHQHPVRAADTDDVILARALEFSAWAKRNARMVIAASVIAAALLGGFIYYHYVYLPQREARAATQLMQVERTVESGNATLAQRDLQDFIRRFDGTVEADQARLMLARLHLEEGRPREAVSALQAVDRGADTPVGARAGLLLGIAQNQAGQRDAAVATYLRVAEEADLEYFREEALSEAALLRQQAGDFAGAAQLWQRLVEMFEEGTMQRSIYEMRLAEAEGRALGASRP